MKDVGNFDISIDDYERRLKGAFFTPRALVEQSHAKIEEVLGSDWKDEYAVWDCCSGTGNLTAGYKFKELYSSTISEAEHNLKVGNNINPEAVHFVYDFLKSMDTDDLPNGLQVALKAGRVVIFINPPYGSGGKGVAGNVQNGVNAAMKKAKIGMCSRSFDAQFIYKSHKILNGGYLAVMVGDKPYTGPSATKLRPLLGEFKGGLCCGAGVFSGTSNIWMVTFSIWKSGVENKSHEFVLDIRDNKMNLIGEKLMYDLDNDVKASIWVREATKGLKTEDAPQQSSTVIIKQKGRGKIVKGSMGAFIRNNSRKDFNKNGISIGYFHNHSNDENHNEEGVNLYTGAGSLAQVLSIGYFHNNSNDISNGDTCVNLYTGTGSHADGLSIGYFSNHGNSGNSNGEGVNLYTVSGSQAHGLSIGYFHNSGNNIDQGDSCVNLFSIPFTNANGFAALTSNVFRVISLFAARKLITGTHHTWMNDPDAYLAPDESHKEYEDWLKDCLVYSLFNVSSQQGSLRNIDYKGEDWDILNEWFYMHKEEMGPLPDAVEADYEKFGRITLFTLLLNSVKLSPEAQAVLDEGKRLTVKSMAKRENADKSWHLDSWDAGWNQVKKLLDNEDKKAFSLIYAKLADRMRPMVYKLGFLKESVKLYG